MGSSEVRVEVEVREIAGELALLTVLGVASLALVAGLAYAVLGGEQDFTSTSGSIERAGRLIAFALAAGAILLAAVLIKPRPRTVVAVAAPGTLGLERAGKTRRISRSRLRSAHVVLDGDTACVELERRFSTVRLIAASRDDAERLAGAFLGTGREPAATARVRRRADYYNFLLTAWMWLVAYGCVCVLPPAPLLGAILLAIALPLTVWVTLRAVPAQVLASEKGLTILHPLQTRSVPADELAGARVIDDDRVLVILTDGKAFRIPE
ncbi:MAG TPA: hypothetical protein VGD74_09880, partial [Vulgatibacter sp.]